MGFKEYFKRFFRRQKEPDPKVEEDSPPKPRNETGMMQWGPRRGSGGW